jgi:hypothetical protein
MRKTPYILRICVSALLLSGCAIAGPTPNKLAHSPDVNSEAKTGSAVANAEQDKGKSNQSPALAYETAANECTQQAEKKSIGSVLAIFTQWRPGTYSATYAACMKGKGYTVN